MAKKKKTRKQKVLSDLRHLHITPKSGDSSEENVPDVVEKDASDTIFRYSVHTAPAVAASPQKATGTKTEYHYITQDLRKTAFLTTAILASQIILYFVLTRIW